MDASKGLTLATRIGFATRGALYLVIAYLIVRTGKAEDTSGAIAYLGEGGGQILLAVMAIGLFAYGIWRLSDAIFDAERHGTDKKGMAERVGAGASGAIHLFLGWQAVSLMQGASSSSGSGAQEGAQTALDLPGGTVLVLLGALVLLGVGLFQLRKAYKASFLCHLEGVVAQKAWALWSGRAGYAARGLVFLVTGYFLAQAGFQHEASEAGGMEQALGWLDNPWDVIVGLGFAAFGVFSLIEARYRVLHDVPVDEAVQRIVR